MGIYNVALRMVTPFVMVFLLGLQPLMPLASRLYKDNREQFTAFLKKWLSLFGVAVAVLSISLLYSSDFIMHLLFGNKFDSSIPLLELLTISLFIQCLFGFFNLFLVASSHKNTNRVLGIMLIGLFLNGILFFVFFRNMGALGVVYNRLISDTILFILAAILSYRLLSRKLLPQLLVLSIILAGIFFLAVKIAAI